MPHGPHPLLLDHIHNIMKHLYMLCVLWTYLLFLSATQIIWAAIKCANCWLVHVNLFLDKQCNLHHAHIHMTYAFNVYLAVHLHIYWLNINVGWWIDMGHTNCILPRSGAFITNKDWIWLRHGYFGKTIQIYNGHRKDHIHFMIKF